MSTFTYAACFDCKKVLDLDKYAGYAEIDHFSIPEKSLTLHKFLGEHGGHDTRVFTEHAESFDEMFASGCEFKDWLTGEIRTYRTPPKSLPTAAKQSG